MLTIVNDASSWPTPQTAQGEDLRKAQDQADKPERTEKEKPAGSRTHGKEKWMPVPYVPTAVFNTPLPPAARRGGRSGGGGPRGGSAREGGGSRGGGDRAATSTSSSKPSSAGEREKGDATESAQKSATSTAADATLKNGDAAGAPSESTKDNKPAQNSINTAATVAATTTTTTTSDPTSSSQSPTRPHHSKSYHKSHDNSSSSYKNAHPDQHASRQANSDSHAGSGHSRYANHDRRFDMGARSGEFFKDYQPRGEKEFSKDREYSREYTRESRSERGGRGGYRGGRGGHSNYNNNNNSTSTTAAGTTQTSSASASSSSYHSAPIPQHPFPSSKSYNSFSDRHRIQPSANGAQQQQQQQQHQQQQPHSATANNRMNMRSPSMPNPGIFPAPYPIQTDMNILYPYPHALPAGPMTAMSYQPYMEHYSLMGTISMQLEYYFSVDNLCKDLFLRRHMDSQGYVLLSVIASFKRIKSLTEDMELLRFVCRQLRNVEYRPGEDGVDRLRKREEWAQWVLSMDERDPSARNEGPSSATAQEYIPQHQQVHMNGHTHAHAHAHAHAHGNGIYVNANYAPVDNHSAEEPKRPAKLSSAAPEFSPLSANGHTPSFEQGSGTPVDAQGQSTDGSNFVAVNVGQ
ncbi:La domain-containing protein, variant 1 [Trichophyton interdigitale]|nr:La domain-containing protein, variant 1 [Trichophyton interdigitale]